MANVFTSIATAGGWQTNTVEPAWDLVFSRALNAHPIFRQFVDKRPERPTHRGDSVTLQITNYFSEAAVTASKTPLTDEVDVDSIQLPATSTVTLTPNEYGAAVTRTLKLANRSMVPVDPEIAIDLADHCAKVIDELLQDEAILGSQVYYGGTATSTATVSAGETLTSTMIRKGVTKLRANQAQTRDGQHYVGVLHPNVSYDLRSESGSGGWRVPQEYLASEGRLYAGEIGLWEGARFIENARTRKAADGDLGATVYRSFLLGREALAEAVVVEPHVVIGPEVDKLRRNRSVGWYADLDFGIFRDQALVRFESATAAS